MNATSAADETFPNPLLAYDYICEASTTSIVAFLIITTLFYQRISCIFSPLHAHSIPLVPHYLPFFGMSIQFAMDTRKFLTYWQKYYDTEVFGCYFLGRMAYVITCPIASAQVFSGKYKSLTWEYVVKMIYTGAFETDDKLAKLLGVHPPSHRIYDKYLMNRTHLVAVMKKFEDSFVDFVFPKMLEKGTAPSEDGWITMDAIDLFGGSSFMCTSHCIFGDTGFIDDEIFRNVMIFITNFQKILMSRRFMRPFYRKEYAARDAIFNYLKEVIRKVDEKERGFEQYAEVMQEISKTEVRRNLNLHDRTVSLMAPLYAASVNTIPTTCWAFWHLLNSKECMEAIKEEVLTIRAERLEKQRLNEDDSGVRFTVDDFDRMVKTDSLIHETLRLHTTYRVVTTRYAEADCVIKVPHKGKLVPIQIRRGDLVFNSPTLNHLDSEVFEDPEKFKWNRFCPVDGKYPVFCKRGKELSKPVRAFGYGQTMCPGRKFAMTQIKLMMAVMLEEYDIRYKDNITPPTPKMAHEERGPCNGMPRETYKVELRKRV